LSDQWIRELLGEKPLTNPEYSHLFRAGIRYRDTGGLVTTSPAIRDQTWDYRAIFGLPCDLSYFGKQTSPILFNSVLLTLLLLQFSLVSFKLLRSNSTSYGVIFSSFVIVYKRIKA